MRIQVHFEEDPFDSADNDLRLLDADTYDHPQGAFTLATINVRPFAPHMSEPLALADLFSAAPDMLEALEALLWQWDNHGTLMGMALQDARAVVAKAKTSRNIKENVRAHTPCTSERREK